MTALLIQLVGTAMGVALLVVSRVPFTALWDAWRTVFVMYLWLSAPVIAMTSLVVSVWYRRAGSEQRENKKVQNDTEASITL